MVSGQRAAGLFVLRQACLDLMPSVVYEVCVEGRSRPP